MADEEYWTKSAHGFDFGDTDSWAACSNAVPKLSAAVRKTTAVDDLEQLHFGGFKDFAEKETFSPDSSASTESLISYRSPPHSNTSVQSLLQKANHLKFYPKDSAVSAGKATPQRTIIKMILGLDFCLEQHKTKEEKIALLEAAIKSHDGNAIIAVVLFMRSTLRKSIFQREILERPEAVNHYLYYLQMDHEHDELANMLLMLGKTESAAMLKYKAAIEVHHAESKLKKLENCLNTHFQVISVGSFLADLLAEHICILQRQLPIEDDDARQERDGLSEIFKTFPRSCTLVDMPVVTTLYYCCLYHYNLPENHLASPVAIRKQHKLTDKQFIWIALLALVQLHQWSDVENLFHIKRWIGGTKIKCCIGFHNVAEALAKAGAPKEIFGKYIKLVENSEERLNLARKHKFHQLVLETLTNMRDRQGLLSYKSELLSHSVEYAEVEEALLSSNTKWRN